MNNIFFAVFSLFIFLSSKQFWVYSILCTQSYFVLNQQKFLSEHQQAFLRNNKAAAPLAPASGRSMNVLFVHVRFRQSRKISHGHLNFVFCIIGNCEISYYTKKQLRCKRNCFNISLYNHNTRECPDFLFFFQFLRNILRNRFLLALFQYFQVFCVKNFK